jgi:NADPH:quinone reductase
MPSQPTLRMRRYLLKDLLPGNFEVLQNTSAEQRREDVAEAIEISRATPEQFDVEADYDLGRFGDAIKHTERTGRNGAVLISSDS